MTAGLGGLLLHLWLIAGFTVIGSAVVVSLLHHRLSAMLSCFGPSAKRRFVWYIAALPWVLGAAAAALTLVPSMDHALGFTLDHCHSHGDGHGHLCWFHPPLFGWRSWMGIGVGSLFGLTLWKSVALTRHLWQQQTHLKTLLTFARRNTNGSYTLDTDSPMAFTAGWLAPKVVVSQCLIEALTAQELNIVQHHEQVHQRRRDPMELGLFHVILCVFLPFARRNLQAALELALEQMADAEVSLHESPADIAATLVKVSRLNLRFRKQQIALGSCSFGVAAVEERVRLLLSKEKGRPFPWGSFGLSSVFLLVAAVSCADSFHHAIETILHHHP